MSASTQSLLSLYSPLAMIRRETNGPNWTTDLAAESPEKARFGFLGLVLGGLPPCEIAAVIPVVDSLDIPNESTEGDAYQLPGRGDMFVAPYRQFLTAIRPFTLRWESHDPANSQLASYTRTTLTHTGGERQRIRRRSHGRNMCLAHSDMTSSG